MFCRILVKVVNKYTGIANMYSNNNRNGNLMVHPTKIYTLRNVLQITRFIVQKFLKNNLEQVPLKNIWIIKLISTMML